MPHQTVSQLLRPMRVLSVVLALTLVLAACRSREPQPSEETLDSLAGPTLTAPRVDPPAPDEVLALDTAFVGAVIVERGDGAYTVDVVEGQVTAADGAAPLDRAALGRWLARLAPLRAEGRFDDLTPQAVQNGADATLDFAFTDGSGRTVSFLRHADGVAAVSQDDGPVWRLAADALDALVPDPATLSR